MSLISKHLLLYITFYSFITSIFYHIDFTAILLEAYNIFLYIVNIFLFHIFTRWSVYYVVKKDKFSLSSPPLSLQCEIIILY